MRDIPIFTTDYGVASLLLKEIPYKHIAYVKVQDVQPGQIEALLEECVGFCRAAGAEAVFAFGSGELERYPLYCSVLEMSGSSNIEYDGCLWPVTAETVSQWREIYNTRMADVDNAATMTAQDEKRIVESAGAYFVHRNGVLLGVGWVEDKEVLCIASVIPGEGKNVLGALLSVADGDQAVLRVASTNSRAISLYEKMGFICTSEKSRFYRVY